MSSSSTLMTSSICGQMENPTLGMPNKLKENIICKDYRREDHEQSESSAKCPPNSPDPGEVLREIKNGIFCLAYFLMYWYPVFTCMIEKRLCTPNSAKLPS